MKQRKVSNWNVANQLTIIRMALVPFFILFYYLKQVKGHMAIATAIAMIAAATDFFDGFIARKYNLITNLGKILDPLSDKILTISALVLFAESGLIPAWCILIVIFREFTISAFRIMASSKGKIIPASILGKAKTLVQLIGIMVLLLELSIGVVPYKSSPVTAGQIIIYISIALTLISFIEYIVKEGKALVEEDKKAKVLEEQSKTDEVNGNEEDSEIIID